MPLLHRYFTTTAATLLSPYPQRRRTGTRSTHKHSLPRSRTNFASTSSGIRTAVYGLEEPSPSDSCRAHGSPHGASGGEASPNDVEVDEEVRVPLRPELTNSREAER